MNKPSLLIQWTIGCIILALPFIFMYHRAIGVATGTLDSLSLFFSILTVISDFSIAITGVLYTIDRSKKILLGAFFFGVFSKLALGPIEWLVRN